MTPEQRERLRENTVFYSRLSNDSLFRVHGIKGRKVIAKDYLLGTSSHYWDFFPRDWRNTTIIWAGGSDEVEVIVE